jgi:hypothetical protein
MEDIAKPKNKPYLQWGIPLFILVVIVVAYSQGYRIKNNLLIGKMGTITMNLPLIQTSVFVDENKKTETTKDNENVKLLLSPRTHNIIVSHTGYYPWTKKVAVPSNGTVVLSPIFVTINASGEIITQKDPEYWKIRSEIINSKLPAKNSPLLSADKSSTLWMDDNAIIVNIASTTHVVIQPDTVINNVSFYKNRSDVVIFSTGNGIYVIEVEKENTQNFMPIYKGASPYFMPGNEGFIYVLDGDNLMQVVI